MSFFKNLRGDFQGSEKDLRKKKKKKKTIWNDQPRARKVKEMTGHVNKPSI
jgi:hypothetical protein